MWKRDGSRYSRICFKNPSIQDCISITQKLHLINPVFSALLISPGKFGFVSGILYVQVSIPGGHGFAIDSVAKKQKFFFNALKKHKNKLAPLFFFSKIGSFQKNNILLFYLFIYMCVLNLTESHIDNHIVDKLCT